MYTYIDVYLIPTCALFRDHACVYSACIYMCINVGVGPYTCMCVFVFDSQTAKVGKGARGPNRCTQGGNVCP